MTYKIKVHGQGRVEEIEIKEWPCTITYQPERLNPETSSPYGLNRLLLETPMSEEMAKSFGRCDSLNSVVTQREESEEILPPKNRS